MGQSFFYVPILYKWFGFCGEAKKEGRNNTKEEMDSRETHPTTTKVEFSFDNAKSPYCYENTMALDA